MSEAITIKSATRMLEQAYRQALGEVAPERLIAPLLKRKGEGIEIAGRVWSGPGRLVILAAGKAALPMAKAADKALGNRLDTGLLVAPLDQDLAATPAGWEALPAEHPVPGQGSARAAARIAELARTLGEDDFLLLLLSGGATALLAAPRNGLNIRELQSTFETLLHSGADIVEMNRVRKHLTTLGGGRLARLAAPAQVDTLALSDVPGDNPSTIGSGPTVPDFSTFAEALGVIQRHGLENDLPKSVLRFLRDGIRGVHEETPKRGEACFSGSRFRVIGSAQILLEKLAGHLRSEAGAEIWETGQLGSINYQVKRLIGKAHRKTAENPTAILCAGEPTLKVQNGGTGGRASHFALGFALEARTALSSRWALLSAATDGKDGNCDAAGAIVTHESLESARQSGLDPQTALAHFDSASFLAAAGCALVTGSTQTNFSDVRVLLQW